MPSGKVHYELWKKYRPLAVASAIGVACLTNNPIAGASTLAGYYVGALVSPDLDLVSIDRAESLMIRSVIFLPLIAWSTLYARVMQVFGGHRSMASHSLVVSTFIRLCWFAFPVVIVLYYFGYLPNSLSVDIFTGTFIGLSIADAVHIMADFYSSLRRVRSRRSVFSKMLRVIFSRR